MTGKRGIFRQEAEPGVDRIAAGDGGSSQDCLGIEVAVLGCRRTDAQTFVSQLRVQGILVRFGANRNRLDAHFATSPDDRDSDFTAVWQSEFS